MNPDHSTTVLLSVGVALMHEQPHLQSLVERGMYVCCSHNSLPWSAHNSYLPYVQKIVTHSTYCETCHVHRFPVAF